MAVTTCSAAQTASVETGDPVERTDRTLSMKHKERMEEKNGFENIEKVFLYLKNVNIVVFIFLGLFRQGKASLFI